MISTFAFAVVIPFTSIEAMSPQGGFVIASTSAAGPCRLSHSVNDARRTLLLAACIATTSFAHDHAAAESEEAPHWLLGVEAGAGAGIGDVSFEVLVRGGFQFLVPQRIVPRAVFTSASRRGD